MAWTTTTTNQLGRRAWKRRISTALVHGFDMVRAAKVSDLMFINPWFMGWLISSWSPAFVWKLSGGLKHNQVVSWMFPLGASCYKIVAGASPPSTLDECRLNIWLSHVKPFFNLLQFFVMWDDPKLTSVEGIPFSSQMKPLFQGGNSRIPPNFPIFSLVNHPGFSFIQGWRLDSHGFPWCHVVSLRLSTPTLSNPLRDDEHGPGSQGQP